MEKETPMGALRGKRVEAVTVQSMDYRGIASYEGENYLMLVTDDGVTVALPWYSIASIEVLRK